MADIEIAARFALACQFALLAIVLLRDHRGSTTGLMGGLFAVAGFADLMPGPFGPRAGLLGAVFQAANISGILWFWLLAKSLFDDAFKWRASFLIILAVLWIFSLGAYFYTDAFTLVEAGAVFEFDRYKAALIPQQAMILGLSALVIFEALKDWRNDLVESRRRFRRLFLLVVTILLLTLSFSNYLQLGTERNPAVDAVISLIGLVLVMVFISALLRVRTDAFSATAPNPFPSAERSDSDEPMIGEINELMEEQQLYTEHGLTITTLAARLKEKEYRVREVINGGMGYRNFSQFLNHFRVQEASRRLVNPEARRLPVLTIAFDVGYASLAPFNKAFKAIHGVTPTEYRKQLSSR
ncbi:MAG: helix-turn-helix domain-containing protein [Pseudomonadales bacterium]